MIVHHSGNITLGETIFDISVLVEINDKEYDSAMERSGETDDIANQALNESKMLNSVLGGKVTQFFNHIKVHSDDSYAGTLVDANNRGKNNTWWHQHYEDVFNKQVCCKVNDREYQCNVSLFTKKLSKYNSQDF